MGDKNIKAGETYNVRVKVIHVDSYKNVRVNTVDENGKQLGEESTVFYSGELRAFSPITPENGIKNTEPAPKYEPCRKFRKGDKVKLRKQFLGRETTLSPYAEQKFNFDDIYTIEEDEEPQPSLVAVVSNDGEYSEEFCFYEIELVTPVEELEPYRVETGGYNRFRIKKGNLEYSYFPFGEHCVLSMDEAKAAAEAECARLNAEHRKEHSND